MPRGGSKKGEHRGNAKRRDTRETPNDIMHEALSTPPGQRSRSPKVTERRLELARVISGPSGRVTDMTPKEVLLCNMHYFMQGAFDWQDQLMRLVEARVEAEGEDERKEAERAQMAAEAEIERFRRMASEDAFKVAPFIHPRLAAVAVGSGDQNPDDIVQALLDDIDARQRDPRVIEHRSAVETEAVEAKDDAGAE